MGQPLSELCLSGLLLLLVLRFRLALLLLRIRGNWLWSFRIWRQDALDDYALHPIRLDLCLRGTLRAGLRVDGHVLTCRYLEGKDRLRLAVKDLVAHRHRQVALQVALAEGCLVAMPAGIPCEDAHLVEVVGQALLPGVHQRYVFRRLPVREA